MNKRQEELLTILIGEDDYISVEDITSRLKCSERTIRNYIKDINSWLNTFSNMYIYRKANKSAVNLSSKKIVKNKIANNRIIKIEDTFFGKRKVKQTCKRQEDGNRNY